MNRPSAPDPLSGRPQAAVRQAAVRPAAGHLTAAHLSEDQLDEILIAQRPADVSSACAAHLAVCGECQARLSEVRETLAGFNAVSLAWSERRSATLPQSSAKAHLAWRPRLVWATAGTLVLAFGLVLPLAYHPAPVRVMNAPALSGSTSSLASPGSPADVQPDARANVPPEAEVARETQIGSDNQLLADIARELGETADPPSVLRGTGTAPVPPESHRRLAGPQHTGEPLT